MSTTTQYMFQTQTLEGATVLSPVGRTAQFVAVIRALESESSKPLFDDPLARAFVGDEGFVAYTRNKALIPVRAASLFVSAVVIRTKFFDQAIMDAVSRGIRQVVIIGAGFDSRAFRLPFPEGVKLWELDRQDVLDYKNRVIKEVGSVAACDRKTLTLDLREDWRDALCADGFDPSLPSAFLLEGLLLYLTDEDVQDLLHRVGSLSCPGSWLGVDVVATELLEFETLQRHREWQAAMGAPWLFGTRNPEKLMGDHGWTPHCSGPGEKDANFGRWPFPAMPRWLPGIPRTYFISATR